MSGFTESGFERKLAELNSTQLSIQTLSMWLVHHRKHVDSVVKVWYKEFLKAQEHRKLDKELDDRKTVSMKLQDLICVQKDLLTQSEHRLEEHQQYGKILSKKLEEMKFHVQSMPDLTKLPSVTDGLAPLPSAGDLFNI